MESFKVEITSRETIKPSTPTPPHLKSHKLCLLDQLFPSMYVPSVLFYKTNPTDECDQATFVAHLKESLSKTLSLFYPLSGRLSADESYIDCNDKGISFIEAQSQESVYALLKSPNRTDLVRHFIPNEIYDIIDINHRSTCNGNSGGPLELKIPLLVQVTRFKCGGIAIGYQWLHKIDAVSWGGFLKTWAAITSYRDEDVMAPDFDTAVSLFPPCGWAVHVPSTDQTRSIGDDIQKDNGCIVKAFGFSPNAIVALQNAATSEHVPCPTRVEAVSGFIWKHLMAAAFILSNSDSKSPGRSVLIHTVDMRPCRRPPLPPTAIGNFLATAIAFWDLTQKPVVKHRDLVEEIRKCISEAKDLSEFQSEQGIRRDIEKLRTLASNNNINLYKFTSWSRNRLGLNANFGFGVPDWIGYTGGTSDTRNSIILIETMDRGIEAWLELDKHEMEALTLDSEFLAFASPVN